MTQLVCEIASQLPQGRRSANETQPVVRPHSFRAWRTMSFANSPGLSLSGVPVFLCQCNLQDLPGDYLQLETSEAAQSSDRRA